MSSDENRFAQRELRLGTSPVQVCRKVRGKSRSSLLLDGSSSRDGWEVGPLLALAPDCRSYGFDHVARGLEELDRLVALRRAAGGPAETGVAALLSYELFERGADSLETMPAVVLLTVDRSVRFLDAGRVLLTVDGSEVEEAECVRDCLEPTEHRALSRPARCTSRPRTSLPRPAYLRAVERVQEHIARGDIYQGNLCQRFDVEYAGDPLEAYAALTSATPAPRSAYLETPGLALASASPETFLRATPDGRVETRPIKGTRPRGFTEEADRAQARALLESGKDRAELLMIVDLERNDLSRVCRVGSVEVPELAGLETYAAVHHLVARVRGRLVPGVGVRQLLRATFPGGSITGAPKIRAMEILRELEPVRRGFFTGSLFWFGDDGTLDSSILIRTWVFAAGRGRLGAGGGIVADSDPEEEWRESNHKARALAMAMGFEPEEAA